VLGVGVAMAIHKAGRNVVIGCAQATEIVAKGSMFEVGNGRWAHYHLGIGCGWRDQSSIEVITVVAAFSSAS